jgi:hypothetical protein
VGWEASYSQKGSSCHGAVEIAIKHVVKKEIREEIINITND